MSISVIFIGIPLVILLYLFVGVVVIKLIEGPDYDVPFIENITWPLIALVCFVIWLVQSCNDLAGFISARIRSWFK